MRIYISEDELIERINQEFRLDDTSQSQGAYTLDDWKELYTVLSQWSNIFDERDCIKNILIMLLQDDFVEFYKVEEEVVEFVTPFLSEKSRVFAYIQTTLKYYSKLFGINIPS